MSLSNDLPNSIGYWYGTDSKEIFDNNWGPDRFNKRTRELLISNGFTQDTVIEYQLDHYGLRNEPNVDIGNSLLALGCSYTFGNGLDINDTWASQLGKLTDISVYNAGISGSSNDTAFRLANYLIPKYKPQAVFLLSPFKFRYEFYEGTTYYNYTASKGAVWIEPTVEMASDLHNELNAEKNILAIKSLCDREHIPFIWLSINDLEPVDFDFARDLAHVGRKAHDLVAIKMKQLFEESLDK